MLPVKIKDGVASINVNKTRKLTRRQLAVLEETKKAYGELVASDYLNSLMGWIKQPVKINRLKVRDKYDHLAMRPKELFLAKFKQLLYNDADDEHVPSQRSVGNWVGVEIECYYPTSSTECTSDCDHEHGECYADKYPDEKTAHFTLCEALQKAGVTRCSVKGDGSLESDDGVGVEVTILFNTEDGFGPLQKLCQVLNEHGCFVNKKCGLHVHLDMRHLKEKGAKLVGRRLGRALPILKWIVDPSRHDNTYCKLEVSPMRRSSQSRYYAVNLNAFYCFQTIEVRMHGGSTNATKIKNWIELLRFVGSRPIPKNLSTFQEFIDLGLPEHLIEYADKRISRLNPNAWAHLIQPTQKQVEFGIQLGLETMRELMRR